MRSWASQIQVATLGQCCDFAIRYRAFQHPETTVRLDASDAPRAESRFCAFQTAGNFVGGLDMVDLHIHYADAKMNPRVDVLQRFQIRKRPMRGLKNQMIDVEQIQEIRQRAPIALLNRLPA